MSASAKNEMNIQTFMKIAPRLPPEIAVLVRAPTGIGKSQVTAQLAKQLGLPVIDVRGSTMDEAKCTGIPDFETSKVLKVATFVLPSWYVRACREPVILFLDELNRSMPQVMQAFFQVVLDRGFGNDATGEPVRLHPQTRVYAAVNFGAEYDVVEMDPALLRRFWTVDLEADPADWIVWAKGIDDATGDTRIHQVMIEFIRENPQHWRVDPASGKVTPGAVLPTPASWHRLDTSFKHMEIDLSDRCGTKDDGLLYGVTRGFVGNEAAISFVNYIEKYQSIISAADLLNGKIDKSKLSKLKASDISELVKKVVDHCEKNVWTKSQVENLTAWFRLIPGEQQVGLYNGVLSTKKMENVKAFHGPISMEIVKVMTEAKAKSSNK